MAGIESMANRRSVNSMRIKTRNKVVIRVLLFFRIKNRPDPESSETEKNFFAIRTNGWFFTSLPSFVSGWMSILPPVNKRNPPKMYRIQSNLLIRAAPRNIKTKRKTTAPKMPQNRIFLYCSKGTLKLVRIIRMTNRLSRDSVFSTRYPARKLNERALRKESMALSKGIPSVVIPGK